jgi:prephenate dehydrogenase
LIGASIGLALRQEGWDVSGWDPNADALHEAKEAGAIARELGGFDEAVDSADVIFLCGPLEATVAGIAKLEALSLITDVSSVKVPVVAAAGHLPNFVGGHPMAGSAVSGARFASAHLFHGATWVLCEDNASGDSLARVSDLVKIIGANPLTMTAGEHDSYVATVSHLPRVLASALIELVARTPKAMGLSAGSFRDLTRVAGSGASWWSDILISNRIPVAEAIDGLVEILAEWKSDLADSQGHDIVERLESAREQRSHLGAPVAEVRVVLFDHPGEVGRVGLALSESGVDLRDIQLRHAEYGGGGILTLSIAAHQTSPLRAALEANGFELEG